jgi:hypothetical protein
MLGPMMDEAVRGWRELRNEDLTLAKHCYSGGIKDEIGKACRKCV